MLARRRNFDENNYRFLHWIVTDMANIVTICLRDENDHPFTSELIDSIAKRITPDNIVAVPPVVVRSPGLVSAVINPNPTILINDSSICLGGLFEPVDSWWQPDSPVPDGTFALLRSNRNSVELVADTTATRTIWYYHNERVLLASTSQRALSMLLGGFERNEQAIAWMLSSGCLGPGNSWDRRLTPLGPAQRLRLDRPLWRVSVTDGAEPFEEPVRARKSESKSILHKAVVHTLGAFDFDTDQWALPLSGGVDSRALLLLSPGKSHPKCVTWGLRSSQKDVSSDAYIAKRLADLAGVEHTFYPTDFTPDKIGRTLIRFVEASEGRVDNISGYMDGMAVWKRLFEDKVYGILRGDVVFGGPAARTPRAILQMRKLLVVRDYINLRALDIPGCDVQGVPEPLKRKSHESLATWRDRLYHQYRIPTVNAALNHIKSHYVELVNPLLSRHILQQVWTIPDRLRTNKSLFTELIRDIRPDIPFASSAAIESKADIVRQPAVREFLSASLDTIEARNFFSHSFIDFVVCSLAKGEHPSWRRHGAIAKIERRLGGLKEAVRGNELDTNIVALRAFIALHAAALFQEDSQMLGARNQDFLFHDSIGGAP